jgi:hypothetical protein
MMSNKNPLALLTKQEGFRRCSMGRCCNVEKYIELKEELKKAKKVIKTYASMDLKDYPHMGDSARRFLNDTINN